MRTRARFPDVARDSGHYESFYLKASHPSEPRAAPAIGSDAFWELPAAERARILDAAREEDDDARPDAWIDEMVIGSPEYEALPPDIQLSLCELRSGVYRRPPGEEDLTGGAASDTMTPRSMTTTRSANRAASVRSCMMARIAPLESAARRSIAITVS